MTSARPVQTRALFLASPPGTHCDAHVRPASRRMLLVARALECFERAKQSLFVLGLGYSGLVTASHFQKLGWSVAGTTRSPQKAMLCTGAGIASYAFDPARGVDLSSQGREALSRASCVLVTVPPPQPSASSALVPSPPPDWALATVLACPPLTPASSRRVFYVSSTAVYGDCGGAWVSEASPAAPASIAGRSRLAAERAWEEAAGAEPRLALCMLRCGGIYGPWRSALGTWARPPDPARRRRARALPLDRPVARIHVNDLAGAVAHLERLGFEGGEARGLPVAVNLVDHDPASRREVDEWIRGRRHELGLAPVGAACSDGDNSLVAPSPRPREERRVSNELLVRNLGYSLRYRTFREGLAAVQESEARDLAARRLSSPWDLHFA